MSRRSQLALNAVMTGAVVIWMAPIALAAIAALRSPLAIQRAPSSFEFGDLRIGAVVAFFHDERTVWVVNSSKLALLSVVITVLAAVPLAYTVARHKSSTGVAVLRLSMLGFLVPIPFLALPLLDIVTRAANPNRIFVAALVVSATAIPACAWFIIQAIHQIPRQLFETAAIDRIQHSLLLRKMLLPAILPTVGACAALTFALGWGEATLSASIALTQLDMPLAAAVPLLLGGDVWRWDLILPAVLVMTLPPILAVFCGFSLLRKRSKW
jgi:ABC-type glycerol-3-phosphate transport system permease component